MPFFARTQDPWHMKPTSWHQLTRIKPGRSHANVCHDNSYFGDTTSSESMTTSNGEEGEFVML